MLSLTDKDGIIPQEESNRKNNASADKSRYLRVVPGDIAYNTMRMWEGRSAYVDREGIISPAYTVCKPKGSVNGLFYSYYFKTNQLIEQFRRYSQGLVKDTLTLKYAAFSQIPALAPKPEEQQKVASCLSSLDSLIAAQADKIDALKTHKKGLMQQLFPRESETVPRLRFPEFRDAGEWDEKTLGKVVNIRSGYSPSKYNLASEARHPFLKVEDLNNCEKYQTSSREYSNDSLGVVPPGSIIFPKRGAAILNNKVRLNTVEVLMDTNLMAITPKREMLAEFLYCIVVTEGLSKIADTSTIPQINNKHIMPYVVRIPDKAEQQEIADCLSSLDALIAAHTEKLDALNAHKKGLMQQLFPSPEEVVI